jgi:hypothetical protein
MRSTPLVHEVRLWCAKQGHTGNWFNLSQIDQAEMSAPIIHLRGYHKILPHPLKIPSSKRINVVTSFKLDLIRNLAYHWNKLRKVG